MPLPLRPIRRWLHHSVATRGNAQRSGLTRLPMENPLALVDVWLLSNIQPADNQWAQASTHQAENGVRFSGQLSERFTPSEPPFQPQRRVTTGCGRRWPGTSRSRHFRRLR
jgi:hypothetical protein